MSEKKATPKTIISYKIYKDSKNAKQQTTNKKYVPNLSNLSDSSTRAI